MNITVARIVEIMFQDYELSDELLTIKDEVMSNCQERYQDCIDRGLTDDEAVGAVVESLKGMDEVLKDYPKRFVTQPFQDASPNAEESEPARRHFDFDLQDIREVDISTLHEDVSITDSPDGQVHVLLSNAPNLYTALENGRLRIYREARKEDKHNGRGHNKHYHFNTEAGTFDFSFGLDFLSKLGNVFSFDAIEKATVQLPVGNQLMLTVNTTSGDARMCDTSVRELTFKTMSGDIDVELPDRLSLPSAQLTSTSGDVCVTDGAISKLIMRSMSGDLSANGTLDTVKAQTTSGDVELVGVFQRINAASVSGDVTVEPEEVQPMTISVQSTSGDLTVNVPDGATVTARLKTVSGDIHNRCQDMGESSLIHITASTVSGDLRVR